MSELTVVLHDAETWLARVFGATPASAAIATASTAVGAAATSVEAALPAIAIASANAALALIPGGLGTAFDPIADSLITQVIAILEGKKSTAAPAPVVGTVAGTVV